MEFGFTLFIVGALIILIMLIIAVKRLKHKVFAIFLIIFILITYVGFSVVLRENNVDLKTVPGVISASKLYFSWLGSVFLNVKSATAYVVKMDWGGNESAPKKPTGSKK
ncbi:MAG: hypothetical protein AABW81_04125 [Nanoarchaeota archaeon]